VSVSPTPIFGKVLLIIPSVEIYDSALVSIGSRVLIGHGVQITTDTHEVESSDRRAIGGSHAKKIRIGDDCWLGAGVLVLPGVTIGRGCTIAAGAVVAKDVEENCLVGGVPARLIRNLHPPGPDV
jgi:maltose O-acetyltransferase